MAYILSEQRAAGHDDVVACFESYRDYLERMRSKFPPRAYELATSTWYYDPRDHRCPHDGWLEEVIVSETGSGERAEVRAVSMRVRLLGAYHDGHIELSYPRVFAYQLGARPQRGHQGWRYDEFRLTEDGHVLHEVEWWGPAEAGRWLIEASDVHFEWVDDGAARRSPGAA